MQGAILYLIHLNKVLQKFSTARPSSSVAKHKLLRDTKNYTFNSYFSDKKCEVQIALHNTQHTTEILPKSSKGNISYRLKKYVLVIYCH